MGRCLCALLFLTLLCARGVASAAQSGPPQSAPTDTGVVSGVVTDAATGDPLPGAVVNCGVMGALAGADGGYQLSGLAAGAWRVSARAPGHYWVSEANVAVTGVGEAEQDFALTPLPDGGPSFASVAGLPRAMGAAWGDYDSDGYADLFLTGGLNMPASFTLLRNQHDLTFQEVTAAVGLPTGVGPFYGVAFGDYDNNGRLDALAAANGPGDRLFRNDGAHFTEVAQISGLPFVDRPGRTVSWCDYDRDNWLDVFVCYVSYPPNDISGRLYRNGRDGTFTDATEEVGLSGAAEPLYANSVAWGDYDNDGWPDLAMTRFRLPAKMYRNNGDGTFSETTGAAGLGGSGDDVGVACGDYDNDGWLDLYLGGSSGDRLLHNNHDGTFALASGGGGIGASSSYAVAWADCDNDGYLDLYAGAFDFSGARGTLYRNNADGTFTNVSAAAGVPAVASSDCAVWADADLDGRVDLWVGGQSGSAFLHNTGTSGNWLRVRALTDRYGDAATNTTGDVREAIGARVELNVDDDPAFPPYRTLVRTIDGGSGFLGQNEPVAQFGVPATGPVAVRVLFPNGSVLVHRGVALNQQIAIRDARPDWVPLFDDVPLGYWAAREIEACVDAGIVTGYSDHTYRPTEPVSRAQMAVFIARALAGGDAKVPTGPASAFFSDVPTTSWAFRYVEYTRSEHIVSGYSDGTYRPTEPVTRAQMGVYISRSVVTPRGDDGLATWLAPASPSFPDVPTGYWAYRYVEYAKAAGVVHGYAVDGTYRPELGVTRDQMAVYVARAFGLIP